MTAKRKPWNLAYDTNTKAGKVEPVTFDIPADFCLVIDTREQSPLFTKPPKGLLLCRDTLHVGDYSVRGFESSISIERKSLPDLYGSIGKGRDRFKRELETLSTYEYKALVVEGHEPDILRWQDFSQMHPNSVRHTIVSINVRLGIQVHFATREHLERWVLDRLIKFYLVKRGK